MTRLLYSLVLYLLLPVSLLKLIWRGLRQPAYFKHWGQRYGWCFPAIQQPCIWLHCVSVGETRAASSLIEALLQQYPQQQILLTHTTPTGLEAGLQLFPTAQYGQIQRCYLPYDTPLAMRRFIKHVQPQCGILLETELWVNLIAACQAQHIPLLLVNARLSEKSATGYGKFAKLTRPALQALSLIAAQTEQDAARFAQLMANPADHHASESSQQKPIQVTGNLKFDIQIPADAQSRGLLLRQLIGSDQPLVLMASTREGEEALLLKAWQACQSDSQLLLGAKLLLVPRHPQRFDQVAELVKQMGLRLSRRSQFAQGNMASEIAQAQVILGDSMGEMATYYAASDMALIGGSLLPFGGQNLIEACAVGTPVLLGPHTFNFAQAAQQAVDCGAAIKVQNVNELMQQIATLIAQPQRLQAMRQAAIKFVSDNQGATQKTLALIQQVLQENK